MTDDDATDLLDTRMSQGCGTSAGRVRHVVAGEEPCSPCVAAQAGYTTAWRQRRRVQATAPAHGTEQGLTGHMVLDEEPCELCDAWQRGYNKGIVEKRWPKRSGKPIRGSELREEVEWLRSFGWSNERIAERLSVRPSTIDTLYRKRSAAAS